MCDTCKAACNTPAFRVTHDTTFAEIVMCTEECFKTHPKFGKDYAGYKAEFEKRTAAAEAQRVNALAGVMSATAAK